MRLNFSRPFCESEFPQRSEEGGTSFRIMDYHDCVVALCVGVPRPHDNQAAVM